MWVNDIYDVTLAVKVALNPNTTNQPSYNIGKTTTTTIQLDRSKDVIITIIASCPSIAGPRYVKHNLLKEVQFLKIYIVTSVCKDSIENYS